jgi:DNA-binding transcriptional LysR family regulator
MPARRFPSLLALRAFEVAARHLSFTSAARELHVSQAAISRHVRALEADVGRELFRRLHRRVELTAAGSRLAAELAAAFVRIGRAVETVRGNATRRLRQSSRRLPRAGWCRGSGASPPRIRRSNWSSRPPMTCACSDVMPTSPSATLPPIRAAATGAAS